MNGTKFTAHEKSDKINEQLINSNIISVNKADCVYYCFFFFVLYFVIIFLKE